MIHNTKPLGVGPFGVLKCCQDWPCHFAQAMFYNGKCGKCGKIPEAIFDFPPDQFIKRDDPPK